MALPIVHTAADCVNFSLTVEPFISQLISLPSNLIDSVTDIETLKQVYVNTNPFVTVIAFALFLAPIFLIISEVTRNHSQVDRCWGVLPIVNNAHYAIWSRLNSLPTGIIDTICGVSIIWGARLTYNYWRKGGYSIGYEDYRWIIIRNKLNSPFLFFLLNLTFISLVQPILLALITAPTYVFVLLSTTPEGSQYEAFDCLFSCIIVFFVFIETLADQQQWNFQNAKKEFNQIARVPPKYKGKFTSDDLNRGFVVSGLWAWCRHPNFAAEQAVWLTLHQWSCFKSHQNYNWSGIGALCYVLLFQASTPFTESITANKYPDYKQYQRLVGKFIPRLSVDSSGEDSEEDPSSPSGTSLPSKAKVAAKKTK
ncbi:uncharacterized protein PADG_04953 [Paracoccidioides brasiliensis Pb18]|uniref:Steroid 5-alpha reductase C-terminal domain-containing protein n=2 Tax=Paracoccidioides brasiliensis TaxID=121759 RepID=C1GBF2_PARBD|nr:uncharacterized protein PADG_04953 [Paracoccidioides brasiliensis Pb18]EEH48874.1 hypothetical protein PADG_04953 [Paracoccidioides brasiliensis Pb18]ODH27819.1 hypothetical protein ACO22_04097 [Paracoccidioides brasiliensis]ODH51411.1 hypothetical protein GX48_02467 [Paracoccidioides brasiliensis]